MVLGVLRHNKAGYGLNYLRFAWHMGRNLPRFFGTERKHCPCCGAHARFLAFGSPPRFDVICPRCGSFERHRQLQLWIDRNPERIDGARVLHFAPEGPVEAALRPRAAQYTGADFAAGKADVQLDIEAIALPDASMDLVVCLHVLEHVRDRAALAEIHRVLAPGGTALFMFPIVEAWAETLEEDALPAPIRSTAERIRYFGQHDHVRYYGRDVRDRIRAAGFDLAEDVAQEPEVARHGLNRGETLFVATRAR